jgi:TetR/AcrR family transcriptional regulator
MDTKQKILLAARNEFSRKGFDGARVDAIARAAGINKAMIYYHFTSKERLYQAVLAELFEKVSSFVARLLGEDLPAEKRFEELARFYVDVFENAPEFPPLILREMASGGERIREMFSQALLEAEVPRKVRALLDEGVRRGTFRPVDPVHAVTSFIGMNLFYLLFQPLIHSVWEIRDEEAFRRSRPKEVADIFLRGLEAR